MEKFTSASLAFVFVGAMITGFVAWIWKRWNKIEDNAELGSRAITSDNARTLIKDEITVIESRLVEVKEYLAGLKREIIAVDAANVSIAEMALVKSQLHDIKKDLKSMAESMLGAVEKQETRLDQLVFHLLNDRGPKK